MDLATLIQALSDPAAYPKQAEAVEVRQTHISVVFLTPTDVYKVKKPVRFGFLDFSTLDQRWHFCAEEVRLNRRLAPDVYLGVVPIVAAGGSLRIGGSGDVAEVAVHMRRLPEEATFQERLHRGTLEPAVVEKFAERLADFHRAMAATPAPAEFGRFDAVARNQLDIMTQSEAQVGLTVSRAVLDRLHGLTEARLQELRPLIDARVARGMTRDTHGDLHLDHVYYFPEQAPPGDIVVIDCIEFNERFRYIDPVADMAFAYMDFLFHGRADLAETFQARYFQASGDTEGQALLRLYTAYRSAVRGSVIGLKLAEREAAADQAADLPRARAHWLLALQQLETPERRPCLVLVGGLPGTGKSTLARGLAERGGFTWIRSDVVRKELAGLPVDGPSPPAVRAELYCSAATERTYAECLRRAEAALFDGGRVLLDATFREEERRRQFLDAARHWCVPAVLLVTDLPPAVALERLRQRSGDASDADATVYERLAADWQAYSDNTRSVVHPISTAGTPEEAVAATETIVKATVA